MKKSTPTQSVQTRKQFNPGSSQGPFLNTSGSNLSSSALVSPMYIGSLAPLPADVLPEPCKDKKCDHQLTFR